jgi:sulfite reductase (ferredoxin)
MADKGWQWFRDDLERRLGFQLEHDETIVNPRGGLHTDHLGIGEQNDGLYYVGIAVERGRTSGKKLIALAEVVERFAEPGKAEVRLSQKQNILVTNIPKQNIDALCRELEAIGLPAKTSRWRETLVSCTGTEFCNLAVVETKERAKEILEYLEKEVQLDSPIMVSISGCPNSCAQYQIADIGMTGIPVVIDDQIRKAEGFVQPPPDANGKPHNKIDGYNILLGGSLGDNPEFGEELFKKVPAFLAKKVIAQLVRNYMKHRTEYTDGEVETFRDFVARNEPDQLRQWAAIPEWTPPAPKAKHTTPAAALA